jgi:hypothetical protein
MPKVRQRASRLPRTGAGWIDNHHDKSAYLARSRTLEKPQQLPPRVVLANVEALRRELLEKYGEKKSCPADEASKSQPARFAAGR